MSIPLAQFLFTRLAQLNCRSIHGVPGDFMLRALDHLPQSRVHWIGNANELCAGYAADGYARAAAMARRTGRTVPLVGCSFTTYGVGELAGINALAGAYAESSPLVFVVGTPARKHWRSRPGPVMHHTLGDGRLAVYAEMARQFTCAQADLVCDDADQAASRIDDALTACVKLSKPVYINMPCDTAMQQVSSSSLSQALPYDLDQNDSAAEEALVSAIVHRLRGASKPLIVADGLSYPWNLTDEINEIASLTNVPTTCFIAGKGVVDESAPSWIGPLAGPTEYSSSTDLCLLFGPLLSDTNTAGWSAVPDPRMTITFGLDSVVMDGTSHALNSKPLLKKLIYKLRSESMQVASRESARHSFIHGQLPSSSSIGQDALWSRLSKWLRSYDTLLLANGTPLIGGRDMLLPSNVQVIASGIWTSIGSLLPTAQGVAAAKRDHAIPGRTILLEGDGSFQVTCQSISDIIRYKLDVTIIIANNAGYTYERWLNGMHAEYNDVPSWNYIEAGRFFGAPEDDTSYPLLTRKVQTWVELENVLADKRFSDERGLKIVDIVLHPGDIPRAAEAG